jgi:integrase
MRYRVFQPSNSPYLCMQYRVKGKRKQLSLETKYREVADKRAFDIAKEMEMESVGMIAPKAIREAAGKQLVKHIDAFFEDMAALGRSRAHISHTKSRITTLCRECGWKLIKDITPDTFMKWRASEKKLSPKTLNEYLAHMCTLLNWLERKGELIVNPLKTVTKVETRGKERVQRRAFTEEELGKLFGVHPLRGLIYRLAAYTGLRRGEIRALRWSDIKLDAETPHIEVRASTSKNKKTAILPLLKDLLEALRKYRSEHPWVPNDFVVFKRIPTVETLREDLKACGINANKDALGRQVDFHALRHTFCTLLHKWGVEPRAAMELMRHSDMKLTMKTYTDTSALRLSTEIQKLKGVSSILLQKTGHKRVKQSTSNQLPSSSEGGDLVNFPLEQAPLAKAGNGWENIEENGEGGIRTPGQRFNILSRYI